MIGVTEEEKKLGLGGKIKREFGYMKKGAKILPRVVGKKVKEGLQKEWKAYQERQRAEAAAIEELEQEEKAAEAEAFEAERIRQATLRGIQRAREMKGRKTGWRGSLKELGKIGDSISLGEVLGVETEKQPQKVVRESELESLSKINPANYMLSGLEGKKKPKKKTEPLVIVLKREPSSKKKRGR